MKVHAWFADNLALMRAIFAEKGAPRSGFINLRWLGAFCNTLGFPVAETELAENFHGRLVMNNGPTEKMKLHVSDLLKRHKEEESTKDTRKSLCSFGAKPS
eukprot:1188622-Prorocentrum_minimum.AAC.12